jgi:hypothetical protein
MQNKVKKCYYMLYLLFSELYGYSKQWLERIVLPFICLLSFLPFKIIKFRRFTNPCLFIKFKFKGSKLKPGDSRQKNLPQHY